jgi:outer membrane protein assembly factor BamB
VPRNTWKYPAPNLEAAGEPVAEFQLESSKARNVPLRFRCALSMVGLIHMKAAGRSRLVRSACSRLLLLLLSFPLAVLAGDWPQYRGPNHDGVSADRITTQWSGAVTNPVWRVLVTNCLGSLAVSGGRAYTQTRRTISGTNREVCVALDASNGAELWATAVDNALYPDGGVGFDDGPRTTPAVDGDSVFVLSSYLKLHRLHAATGTNIWQKDLRVLYGGNVIGWQNAASPLIENGLIFVNVNSGTSTLAALRTDDGSVAWRSQNEAMTHSTPVVSTIHGVHQLIFATQSGLVSLDPQTGGLLWRFSYPFPYGTSIGVSPVVHEDMVFVCGAHAYGMGSVVMQATFTNNTWSTARLWSTNNPAAHWMTPVAHQGFLYGQFGIQQFDSPTAQLKCIDMRTGVVRWSVGNFGRGATLLVNDLLVSLTELGHLVLAQPNTNAYTELGRFLAIPDYNPNANKCWNIPAVCDGRVYVRSTAYAACYDLSLPNLKLDPPAFTAPDQLQLTIRTTNGAPVQSNRLIGLEVRTATDITRTLTQWTALTNPLVLTGGVVLLDHVDSGTQTQKFFIVTEPK